MSFRKYGGLQYNAKHNIVSSNYNTSNNLLVTEIVGQPNSYIVFESDISGNIIIYGDLDVSGNEHIQGNLDVSGNEYIGGNLTVYGNEHIQGNLDVSGNSNLTAPVTIQQIPPIDPSSNPYNYLKTGLFISNYVDNNDGLCLYTHPGNNGQGVIQHIQDYGPSSIRYAPLTLNPNGGTVYVNQYCANPQILNNGYALDVSGGIVTTADASINSVTVGRGKNNILTNTAIGYQTLFNNTGGIQNTALGNGSLYTNSQGNYNTAVGVNSLLFNTDGSNNTAIGVNSLISNIIGYGNTAVGTSSLYSNTYGGYNTAIGVSSLQNNTLGINNTALGVNSLASNIDGSYNTAIGNNSLILNTTGYENTCLGDSALYFNTTGYHNTAIGKNAGANNGKNGTACNSNTFLGAYSDILDNTIVYQRSTAVGYDSKITASNQIVLGSINQYVYIPGETISLFEIDNTSSYYGLNVTPSLLQVHSDGPGTRVGIGYLTDRTTFVETLTVVGNSVGINNIAPSASYALDVSGNGNFTGNVNAASFTPPSDYRIKENVESLDEKYVVDNLNPVTYKNIKTNKQDIGLIAHELQEVFPDLVNGVKDGEELQSVNYMGLIPVLIKEIKELKKEVQILKKEMKTLY